MTEAHDWEDRILTRIVDADRAAGHPVARSQWAPAGCTCPWPWPLDGKHAHLGCPHYVAAQPAPVPRFLDGCRKVEGAWIHGRRDGDHTCPKWARG